MPARSASEVSMRLPVAPKQMTAWLSDEPMIYDKLTPYEYLEFVAGLWRTEPATAGARARELIGWLGLEPHAHERSRLVAVFSV
jgi:ABC-2 type transport system ATP-binding protein